MLSLFRLVRNLSNPASTNFQNIKKDFGFDIRSLYVGKKVLQVDLSLTVEDVTAISLEFHHFNHLLDPFVCLTSISYASSLTFVGHLY